MDIKNIEQAEEDSYKPVTLGNFDSNTYIESQSNDDKNKTLSIKEDPDEIKSYLKDINSIKKSDSWKIQFTIAISFISS